MWCSQHEAETVSSPSYLVARVVLKQEKVTLASGNMAGIERLIGDKLCQQNYVPMKT
jgi:hypothetical protein